MIQVAKNPDELGKPVINLSRKVLSLPMAGTWSDLKSFWLGEETPSPWIDTTKAKESGWMPINYAGVGHTFLSENNIFPPWIK